MSRTGFLLLVLVLLPLRVNAAAPPPRTQWIAIVAPDFAFAIEPLAQLRRDQGMRVSIVKTTDVLTHRQILAGDTTPLRERVRSLCRTHPGESYVLLVGTIDSLFVKRIVPPCVGTIGRMKDQPTDAPYGCPTGGRQPTVAVGRFPARTTEEAESMVAKTLALEKAGRTPGAWKRRLTVLAGIPAYNPLVDRLVESLAMSRFDRIHPSWSGRAVYTNPQSRFCLPAKELRTRALEYLQQGQAFTLYLGHSNAQTLYGGPNITFLDRSDWGRAKMSPGGVFVTFGCNGCQLKGDDGEGYGIWAMRNPRGPAAVIGSHGICFASMVNLAADGLFQRAFQTTLPDRLAPAWLALLDGVARGRIDWLSYRALDAVDGDSRIPQATQRQEHLEMLVLLGDPALRLPKMESVSFDTPRTITPGERLTVKGELPEGMATARVTVSLERLPGSTPVGLATVPRQEGTARDRALRENHDKSNRFTLVTETVKVRGRKFEVTVSAPRDLPGTECIVRVRGETTDRDAMSAQRVTIRKAE